MLEARKSDAQTESGVSDFGANAGYLPLVCSIDAQSDVFRLTKGVETGMAA